MQEEEACPWSLNRINRRVRQLHNLWCIQISINDLRLQQICCLCVSCLKCVVILQHPLMQWFSKCSVGNPMFLSRGSRRQAFIFIRIPSMYVCSNRMQYCTFWDKTGKSKILIRQGTLGPNLIKLWPVV